MRGDLICIEKWRLWFLTIVAVTPTSFNDPEVVLLLIKRRTADATDKIVKLSGLPSGQNGI